jgi:hypothetical protein
LRQAIEIRQSDEYSIVLTVDGGGNIIDDRYSAGAGTLIEVVINRPKRYRIISEAGTSKKVVQEFYRR